MTVRLSTHIHAATVYRNGALITRIGTLAPADLEAALAGALLLPGLPLLMRADSLRLRVQGAGLSAGPLEEAPALFTAPPPDATTRDRLQAVQQEIRALRAEIETITALRTAHSALQIAALPQKPGDRPVRAPTLSAWLALEDLATASHTRLTEGLHQREAWLQAKLSEEGALTLALQRPRPTATTRTLCATLHRAADAPVEPAAVTLEYFVPGVRWAPVYEVHVDSQRQTARLQMGAQLAQATGEDWRGVAVSTSTLDLQRDTTAPRQDSWRIGRHAPPRPDWRPLPEGLDTLFADYDLAARRRPDTPPPSPPPPAKPQPPPRSAPPQTRTIEPSPATVPSAPPMLMARASMPMPPPELAMPPGAAGGAPMPPRGAPAPKMESSARKRKAAPRRDMDEDDGIFADDAEEEAIGGDDSGGDSGGPGRDLLDYAWLRLSGPDDRRRRGKLLPVDLISDLRAFVEEQGGDPEQVVVLSRALDSLRAAADRLARTPLPPGCQEIQPSSFQHRYPAGPGVDLPSDGVFRRVQVLEAEGHSRLLLRVVPRQDDRVFRFAVLENPLRRPLLPGPLQVYLDGEFMVTGRLGAFGAGAKLSLNLGVEERVRIARNATFQQSEHGMFTASSRLDHRVHLEVRASLPAAATLEVYERLPERASESDDIKLELAETVPPPAQRDRGPDGQTSTGALRWDVPLTPGSKSEISYRYTIDISARKELMGGNRREP